MDYIASYVLCVCWRVEGLVGGVEVVAQSVHGDGDDVVLAAAVLLSTAESETGTLAEYCHAHYPTNTLSSSITRVFVMCCRSEARCVVKCSIHRLKKQPKSGEAEETGPFRAANIVFLRQLQAQGGPQKQTTNPPKNRRHVTHSIKRERKES